MLGSVQLFTVHVGKNKLTQTLQKSTHEHGISAIQKFPFPVPLDGRTGP